MTNTEHLVPVGAIELCVQSFGSTDDPPLLLIGNSMLEWDDRVCARLADGGRHVVRYDLRDTGRSTVVDPDAPAYRLGDLAADAAGLIDALGLGPAHVAGLGVGGWVAQRLALDHPACVRSLTLIATRPTAPGPNDPDLPEHDPAVMSHLMQAGEPDWTDRTSAIEAVVAWGRVMAGPGDFDAAAGAEWAARIHDRTVAVAPPGAALAPRLRASLIATTFAALDAGPRWRERLPELRVPALVVHGAEDRFFPLGNGQALADEIPEGELLTLPGTGHTLPPAAWETVVPAILRHTTG
jgi:pimeloyl-ACP methyl ester carboxylesterase